MQLWVLFATVFSASEARYYYPYPSYRPQSTTTTTVQPPYRRSINDVTVVDEKTGIQYNPYSKHHPGRHVCTSYRNVSHPVHTKRVFCKPTYKKYTVRCGNQWCEGVRLVYEKYHKEMVDNSNHTVVDYTCCPGWTQVNWRSHGCNKPVCSIPCMNGGKCVKPNRCSCPQGFDGNYCENRVSYYTPCSGCSASGGAACPPKICPYCLYSYPPQCCPPVTCPPCSVCSKRRNGLQDQPDPPPCPPCENGATCDAAKSTCVCTAGFEGRKCEKDINECKAHKPCDHICYNTPGSYKCQCKENFTLQKDGQTCRKENDDVGKEARDLEAQKLSELEDRLAKLEKMMAGKEKCDSVSKKDLDAIYAQIEDLQNELAGIAHQLATATVKSTTQLVLDTEGPRKKSSINIKQPKRKQVSPKRSADSMRAHSGDTDSVGNSAKTSNTIMSVRTEDTSKSQMSFSLQLSVAENKSGSTVEIKAPVYDEISAVSLTKHSDANLEKTSSIRSESKLGGAESHKTSNLTFVKDIMVHYLDNAELTDKMSKLTGETPSRDSLEETEIKSTVPVVDIPEVLDSPDPGTMPSLQENVPHITEHSPKSENKIESKIESVAVEKEPHFATVTSEANKTYLEPTDARKEIEPEFLDVNDVRCAASCPLYNCQTVEPPNYKTFTSESALKSSLAYESSTQYIQICPSQEYCASQHCLNYYRFQAQSEYCDASSCANYSAFATQKRTNKIHFMSDPGYDSDHTLNDQYYGTNFTASSTDEFQSISYCNYSNCPSYQHVSKQALEAEKQKNKKKPWYKRLFRK